MISRQQSRNESAALRLLFVCTLPCHWRALPLGERGNLRDREFSRSFHDHDHFTMARTIDARTRSRGCCSAILCIRRTSGRCTARCTKVVKKRASSSVAERRRASSSVGAIEGRPFVPAASKPPIGRATKGKRPRLNCTSHETVISSFIGADVAAVRREAASGGRCPRASQAISPVFWTRLHRRLTTPGSVGGSETNSSLLA